MFKKLATNVLLGVGAYVTTNFLVNLTKDVAVAAAADLRKKNAEDNFVANGFHKK